MTDKELLEAAAKAAGLVYRDDLWDGGHARNADGLWVAWRPLTDDGDALRLAVRLGLCIFVTSDEIHVEVERFDGSAFAMEVFTDDRAAHTRRAIVRAAAEIGKAR